MHFFVAVAAAIKLAAAGELSVPRLFVDPPRELPFLV